MDRLFIVLAGRHGYTPHLMGIYNDIDLANKRGEEVIIQIISFDYFEVLEVGLNLPEEIAF